MKKRLIFLLLFLIFVLFAGCQNKPINTTNKGTTDLEATDSVGNDETTENSQTVRVIEIIDIAERDNIPCDDALQQFFTDGEYNYFYSCIKNEYVIVKYSNSTEKTVADALKTGDITIKDLDKFGIKYYKTTLDGEDVENNNQNKTFQKQKFNADDVSSVTIKIISSLDGGPKQKVITDKALICEMVDDWNNVELRNKVESANPGTTLVVAFNSDIVFLINDGYLVCDGNYYVQPNNLEAQLKKYYNLAKEKETTIEIYP